MRRLCVCAFAILPRAVTWLAYSPAACSLQVSSVLMCPASGPGDVLPFKGYHPYSSGSVSNCCSCLITKDVLCVGDVRLANDCGMAERSNTGIFFPFFHRHHVRYAQRNLQDVRFTNGNARESIYKCRCHALLQERVSNVC